MDFRRIRRNTNLSILVESAIGLINNNYIINNKCKVTKKYSDYSTVIVNIF